jgi:outer membrane scaffolding protein for murein synthesis (MipA/OmpV family)
MKRAFVSSTCRSPVLRALLYLVGWAGFGIGHAHSQGLPEPVAAPNESGWIVTVGAFGDLEPRFEGARRHSLGYHPIIDYRAIGAREWLSLPNDGFDFALIETANFRAGPVVNGRWERDVNSLVRGFRHVADINLSAEAGVFAEWWPADYLRNRVEVRDAVIGARGIVADLSADWVWQPDRQWTWTAGPRLSIADSAFMRSYYSVDDQQSITSGLPPYSAPPGVRSVGAGSMLKYKWSESVSSMAFVEYQRLAPSAAESPLIDDRGSPNQLTVGMGLSYSFRVGW